MPLILPSYMLREKRFKCGSCGFGFIKNTPSSVEKCPMCLDAAYERGVDKNSLDPYSKTKERWYKNHSERHADDIRHREVKTVGGKKVTAFVDSKGRVIDYAIDIPIPPAKPRQTTSFTKHKLVFGKK